MARYKIEEICQFICSESYFSLFINGNWVLVEVRDDMRGLLCYLLKNGARWMTGTPDSA